MWFWFGVVLLFLALTTFLASFVAARDVWRTKGFFSSVFIFVGKNVLACLFLAFGAYLTVDQAVEIEEVVVEQKSDLAEETLISKAQGNQQEKVVKQQNDTPDVSKRPPILLRYEYESDFNGETRSFRARGSAKPRTLLLKKKLREVGINPKEFVVYCSGKTGPVYAFVTGKVFALNGKAKGRNARAVAATGEIFKSSNRPDKLIPFNFDLIQLGLSACS